MERLNKEELRLQEANENPYTFEWMVRNNMFDCQHFLSPYDQNGLENLCTKIDIWTKNGIWSGNRPIKVWKEKVAIKFFSFNIFKCVIQQILTKVQ